MEYNVSDLGGNNLHFCMKFRGVTFRSDESGCGSDGDWDWAGFSVRRYADC